MTYTLFDENAEVLGRFESRGVDLSTERVIDFSFLFPEAAGAEAFARDVELQGFSIRMTQSDCLEDPWDVTASKAMVPACLAITETEETLDRLARRHSGYADGWGFIGVDC